MASKMLAAAGLGSHVGELAEQGDPGFSEVRLGLGQLRGVVQGLQAGQLQRQALLGGCQADLHAATIELRDVPHQRCDAVRVEREDSTVRQDQIDLHPLDLIGRDRISPAHRDASFQGSRVGRQGHQPEGDEEPGRGKPPCRPSFHAGTSNIELIHASSSLARKARSPRGGDNRPQTRQRGSIKPARILPHRRD